MFLAASGLGGEPTPAPGPGRVPVVVELFTSEGCSSCPPADALLIDLDEHQPISGAEVIALGEHVDYWNQLGWKDRFSSAQYSQRQNQYAARFGLDSPYTPQMVVDGRAEFVGNDRGRAAKVIADAAHGGAVTPEVLLAINGEVVDVRVANAGPRPLDVMLAITESDLSTQVGRGENNGRLLHHTAVVHELRTIGTTSGGQFSRTVKYAPKQEWQREHLRAVVFLQNPATLAITGAAQVAWK